MCYFSSSLTGFYVRSHLPVAPPPPPCSQPEPLTRGNRVLCIRVLCALLHLQPTLHIMHITNVYLRSASRYQTLQGRFHRRRILRALVPLNSSSNVASLLQALIFEEPAGVLAFLEEAYRDPEVKPQPNTLLPTRRHPIQNPKQTKSTCCCAWQSAAQKGEGGGFQRPHLPFREVTFDAARLPTATWRGWARPGYWARP